MSRRIERTCHQCEMVESEAADFCTDDDGRIARHTWKDPRDKEIARLKAVLEEIACEEWRGPMGELRLKRVIEKSCVALNHPDEPCSMQVHRAWRQAREQPT